jgi:hypothetical protein
MVQLPDRCPGWSFDTADAHLFAHLEEETQRVRAVADFRAKLDSLTVY